MLFVVLGLLAQCLSISVAAETLTLDTLKLKDGVAAIVPWKTFTSILDFYALLIEL